VRRKLTANIHTFDLIEIVVRQDRRELQRLIESW
jgi:hypothetical protein